MTQPAERGRRRAPAPFEVRDEVGRRRRGDDAVRGLEPEADVRGGRHRKERRVTPPARPGHAGDLAQCDPPQPRPNQHCEKCSEPAQRLHDEPRSVAVRTHAGHGSVGACGPVAGAVGPRRFVGPKTEGREVQAAHQPDDSLGTQLSATEASFRGPDASGLGESFKDVFDTLSHQVERVIRGKRRAIHLALVCLFAEGHLLVEDVPGVGKTSLAKAIARSVGGTWRRIQFTPDLLPSDVTGVSVWDRTRNDFEFRPGGVFANVVLADEINRASPKTQSALLEAMEEQQVTIDAETYPLPSPFLVIATQNPVELEGTYPLPEAQLDRFLLRL